MECLREELKVVTDASKETVPHTTSDPALEADPRWQAAQRAASGSALSRATQLQAILLFLVRNAILQPENTIHESDIARDVLGRRSDFKSVDDNIVRVQMGHLRKKLDLYFSTEGEGEEVAIVIPLGSYKPVFNFRFQPQPQSGPVPEQQPNTREGASGAEDQAGLSPASSTRQTPARTLPVSWVAAACVAALVLGILGTLAAVHLRRVGSSLPNTIAFSNPILHRIFSPDAVVNVVVSDASLVSAQDVVHSDIAIGDYLNAAYFDKVEASTHDLALRSLLHQINHRRYTTLVDADIAAKCYRWGTIAGTKNSVKYARYMHVRDFQQGNFVIIGDRRSNPWTALFEPKLNFSIEEDPATHTYHFRNRNPQRGEPQTFGITPEGMGGAAGYVDVAILPNPAGTGSVLLFNALWGDMIDAAADMILVPDLPPALSRALATQSDHSTTEILLRVHNLDAAQAGTEIVAIRTSNP